MTQSAPDVISFESIFIWPGLMLLNQCMNSHFDECHVLWGCFVSILMPNTEPLQGGLLAPFKIKPSFPFFLPPK